MLSIAWKLLYVFPYALFQACDEIFDLRFPTKEEIPAGLTSAAQRLLGGMAFADVQRSQYGSQALIEFPGIGKLRRNRDVVGADKFLIIVEDLIALITEHAPAEPQVGQRPLVERHLHSAQFRLLQRLVRPLTG